MDWISEAYNSFDEVHSSIPISDIRKMEAVSGENFPESLVNLYTCYGWGGGFCKAEADNEKEEALAHYIVVYHPADMIREHLSLLKKGYFVFGGDGAGEHLVMSRTGEVWLKNAIDETVSDAFLIADNIQLFFRRSIEGAWFREHS